MKKIIYQGFRYEQIQAVDN